MMSLLCSIARVVVVVEVFGIVLPSVVFPCDTNEDDDDDNDAEVILVYEDDNRFR